MELIPLILSSVEYPLFPVKNIHSTLTSIAILICLNHFG